MREAAIAIEVVGAVTPEGVVVRKVCVGRVGGEFALLQTGNLYAPAADEGSKLSPAVFDTLAGYL